MAVTDRFILRPPRPGVLVIDIADSLAVIFSKNSFMPRRRWVLGWTQQYRAGKGLVNRRSLSVPATHAVIIPASATIFNSLAILVRKKAIEEPIGDKKASPIRIKEAV